MPIVPFNVSLAAAGNTQLVPPGNRINSVSITAITAGASVGLKLGNNQPFTVAADGVLRVGDHALRSDAQQGFSLENATAQAGAIVQGIVSYTRPADEKNAQQHGSQDRSITFGQ